MMQLPKELKNFHHAYLIRGDTDTEKLLVQELTERGVQTEGNADFYTRSYETFGIDEARDLVARSQTRAMGESAKYFLITASVITREAQNALLKALEEPQSNSVYFFIVPSPHALLATLRSRMHIIHVQASHSISRNAIAFLEDTFAGRISSIDALVKNGDVSQALSLLADLERALSSMKASIQYADGLRALWRARRSIATENAPLKTMLEHVALLLPRSKKT